VQFPRRGWVHRNRLPDSKGAPAWLTLPLEKAPRGATIDELRFAGDAVKRLKNQMRRFPILGADAAEQPLLRALTIGDTSPVEYLERGLRGVCASLGLNREITRSSNLGIPPEIRGQERILAIVKALGADRYVNASGGEALYDQEAFARRGVSLRFLKPYRGPTWSILHRLLSEPHEEIAGEIRAQL